ncbi:MAG: hypothetical protein M0019_00870 [Actinomycetota bacterium]|nr:hypothetical protein [Actinomycetota bacterium]
MVTEALAPQDDVKTGGGEEETSKGRTGNRGFAIDRVIAYLILIATSIFLLWQYHPTLLFSNTTTTGGDTGAHFSVAYFYIHNILNHFRLTGWSSSWYAGYPLYVFYFPFPGIVTAFLSIFFHYGIAFKLTTVVGTFTLPYAIFYFARSMKVGYLLSALSSVMALAYLFDRSFTIDGGNIASTLAGEFSFSISLSLAFFGLAILLVNPRSLRRRLLSGVVLALSLLSHILPAAFAVAVLLFLVVLRRRREVTWGSAVSVVVMGAICAIWELPLIANYSLSTSMGWSRITTYATSLFPTELRVFIVLAIVGFIASLVLRIEIGALFGTVAIFSAITFIFFPLKAVYNGRVLPFYVLSIYILAGIGIFVIVDSIPLLFSKLAGAKVATPGMARAMSDLDDDNFANSTSNAFSQSDDFAVAKKTSNKKLRGRAVTVLISLAITLVVALQANGSPSWFPIKVAPGFVQSWIKWNYTGYEGKVGFPAYRALMLKMIQVGNTYGCGRAMWEYNSNQNDYGTPMALMLLPYWTNNCVDSMEGLYFESSATTPYHFLNQSELSAAPSDAMAGLPYGGTNVPLGVQHLQLLGVKYYMAFSPSIKQAANADPSLKLIAQVPAYSPSSTTPVLSESWNIYEVLNSQEVQPLTQVPVNLKGVSQGQSSWLPAALNFYQNPSLYPVERLLNGPSYLPSVAATSKLSSTTSYGADAVSNVVTTNDSISFDVTNTKVPVLIKESYFPNFKATGALGPFRATPNEMVVFPTSNHVEISYQNSTADNLGEAISGLSLLIVLLGLLRPKTFTPKKESK